MEIQKTLQKAIGLFRQGLHYQSLDWISQLLESQPEEGKAWELKGLIEDALHWHHLSIHSLETATTLIPISASGQYVLAKNYMEIGKHSLAKSVFSILLKRNDLPEQLFPALSSYLGQYPDLTHLALEVCRKAAQRDPESGETWFGMAYFMGKLGYPREHIAGVLRKAVMIDPEHRHYRIALATLLEQTGKVQDAYLVVKEIKLSALTEIHCSKCLQKLVTIFSLANDRTRHNICLKKLNQLQLTETQKQTDTLTTRFTDSLKN